MSKKILIAYATKSGTTGEIAEEIGRVVREKGFEVDVFPIKGIVDVAQYDAIVVGSGVRIGKIYSEVIDFVKVNRHDLKNIPMAYFVDCLTLLVNINKKKIEAERYLDPLKKLIVPKTVGLFAGRLVGSKIPLHLKVMLKLMRVKEGDFRKWDVIRDWANLLPKRLFED
jgi:menaquinone-dependent protoporphyrinogen oxidase